MGMRDRKTGDAAFACGINRKRQASCKRGLSKAQFCVDGYRSGARFRDLRLNCPVYASRNQLFAITFKIVEPADNVSGLFCARHCTGNLRRLPFAGAVRN